MADTSNRFFIVSTQQNLDHTREYDVLKDTQTGVMYLFVKHGPSGGLTPLLDKDGKPMIIR